MTDVPMTDAGELLLRRADDYCKRWGGYADGRGSVLLVGDLAEGLRTAASPAPMGREAIAAYLLARDEDYDTPPHLIEWATRLIDAGRNEVHSGDCTKESHSCNRCIADSALAHADAILALASLPAERGEAKPSIIIPICCVTGRIAGDGFACGDCDPCGAAYVVPAEVKALIKERDEWADKYCDAMTELDALASPPSAGGGQP